MGVDSRQTICHIDKVQSAAPPQSAIYRTAERAIGDLPAWLTERRQAGVSFNGIASQLQDKNILVSYETVRSWCQRLDITPTSRPVLDESTHLASGATGGGS